MFPPEPVPPQDWEILVSTAAKGVDWVNLDRTHCAIRNNYYFISRLNENTQWNVVIINLVESEKNNYLGETLKCARRTVDDYMVCRCQRLSLTPAIRWVINEDISSMKHRDYSMGNHQSKFLCIKHHLWRRIWSHHPVEYIENRITMYTFTLHIIYVHKYLCSSWLFLDWSNCDCVNGIFFIRVNTFNSRASEWALTDLRVGSVFSVLCLHTHNVPLLSAFHSVD